MNGPTDAVYVFDSNSIIDHVEQRRRLKQGKQFVSVVTEMEVLAKQDLSDSEEAERKALLSKLTVVPLNDEIKETAIRIRRFGKPRPKLPDAIVAATAVALDAPLVTQDERLLRLQYPGPKAAWWASLSGACAPCLRPAPPLVGSIAGAGGTPDPALPLPYEIHRLVAVSAHDFLPSGADNQVHPFHRNRAQDVFVFAGKHQRLAYRRTVLPLNDNSLRFQTSLFIAPGDGHRTGAGSFEAQFLRRCLCQDQRPRPGVRPLRGRLMRRRIDKGAPAPGIIC